jgi:anti-anti-sigma regulatory factor
VLKISTRTDATTTIFELEGSLTGAWVQELEDCWRKAANADRPVRVMVCAVTFMDESGKLFWQKCISMELSLSQRDA